MFRNNPNDGSETFQTFSGGSVSSWTRGPSDFHRTVQYLKILPTWLGRSSKAIGGRALSSVITEHVPMGRLKYSQRQLWHWKIWPIWSVDTRAWFMFHRFIWPLDMEKFRKKLSNWGSQWPDLTNVRAQMTFSNFLAFGCHAHHWSLSTDHNWWLIANVQDPPCRSQGYWLQLQPNQAVGGSRGKTWNPRGRCFSLCATMKGQI